MSKFKARIVSGVRFIGRKAKQYIPGLGVAGAGVAALSHTNEAQAQFVPQAIDPVNVFDYAATGVNVLTIMAGALLAVAGYKITIGIGKRVIGWFGGR